MVLYLDTSDLVKLYVEERDSGRVQARVEASNAVATSLVAYAEVRSAFARRAAEKSISIREYRRIRSAFEEEWQDWVRLPVTEGTISLAGDLAEKHGLRALDAVHLASAIALREGTAAEVAFSCSDRKLQRASRREGLAQIP